MLNPSTLRVVHEPHQICHPGTLGLEHAFDPGFPFNPPDPLQTPSWSIRFNPLLEFDSPLLRPMETP
jgi:hypothetical protein